MKSDVTGAHHHSCHGGHQIGTLPIVPLYAIVTDNIWWSRVIYAIQVGWTTGLKPPSCRGKWTKKMLPKYIEKYVTSPFLAAHRETEQLCGVFLRVCVKVFGSSLIDSALPPDASWEHLQVQRSLSLSLVLNWLPVCVRLLVLPAVPLNPSAWRLDG